MPLTAFEGVIGHERVLGLLERELSGPAGAYLFVGAAGVGKATVASRFATLLVCPEGGRHADPCRSCIRAAAGHHPDVIRVEPEGRQSLGVDQARATIQQSVMTPVEAARKVFLLEEAGTLTEQAANALLKTLEEPTETTVFLLVAESEDDLPPTVGSRCRTVHLGRVEEGEVVAALRERGLDPERSQALARMAGGRPGLALGLVESPEVARFRSTWLALPLQVSDRPGESFQLAAETLGSMDPLVAAVGGGETKSEQERATRDRRRAQQALLATGLEILASWYADSASVQLGGPIRNRDVPVAALTRIPPALAVRNAELVLDAVADLQSNLRPQLLLANLFTSLGDVT